MAVDESLLNLNDDELPPLLLEEDGTDGAAPDEGADDLSIDDIEENTEPSEPAEPDGAEPPKKKKHGFRRFLIVLLILAALAGGAWLAYPRYIAPLLTEYGILKEETVPAEEPAAEEAPAEEAEEPAEPEEAAAEEAEEPAEPEEPAAEEAEESAEPEEAPAEETEEAPEEAPAEETAEVSEEDEAAPEETASEEDEAAPEETAAEETEKSDGGRGQREEVILPPVVVDRSGEKLSCRKILRIMTGRGADEVLCTPTICGMAYDGESEELTLKGVSSVPAEEIEAAFVLYPQLKRIIIPDDDDISFDMDELLAVNLRYPGHQVIWTVHFAGFTLRTDATAFCCNDWRYGGGEELTDDNIWPLQYCISMEDLDVGHSDKLHSAYFVQYMSHLRYLIIADTKISDLTPLANLHELYYLEVFMTLFRDVTPLTGLTNLRYLNIGYTFYYDVTPLMQMTWLDYLWYSGNILDAGTKQKLVDSLPDTEVYLVYIDGYGSTGGGWRQTEGYYAMRDGLDMAYME